MSLFSGLVVGVVAAAVGVPRALAEARPPWAQKDARPVVVLSLKGTVQPAALRYLRRGLETASNRRAALVVLELDTPGGLMVSLRGMAGAILRSPTPVAVHVAPPGARAASAGFFLVLAADVAAMAPATTTGAASPVTIGGGGGEQTTALRKAREDVAAFARSLARQRGRPEAWAEKAVVDARAYTEREALEHGLIHLIASTRTELLEKVDGLKVRRLDGSTTVVRTRGAPVVEVPPDATDRALMVLAHPQIAYLLLLAGLLGLWVELMHPGAIVPGAVGAVSLIAALFALSVLPVSYFALGLLILGAALLAAEAFVTSYGLLALLGVGAFVAGSLLLIQSPIPSARIGLRLVLPSAAVLSGIVIWLAMRAAAAQRAQVATGAEALIGCEAEVLTPLEPTGWVFVEGERWEASLREPGSGASVPAGGRVRIARVVGNHLIVDETGGSGSRPPEVGGTP